jgi:hypothetical protein
MAVEQHGWSVTPLDPANYVTGLVNPDVVVSQPFHLTLDGQSHIPLVTRQTGDTHHLLGKIYHRRLALAGCNPNV